MENILFKISFPAEFHAQTAVEAAVTLHPEIVDRLNTIERIEINTQESAIRIISKEGPLYNYADRDHCLQYMAAIGLIFGELNAHHYSDEVAKDPRIDQLRTLMEVKEDKRYSEDYLDPNKRSIANAIQIFFKDGTSTEKVEVEYPVGHRLRRKEGMPLLLNKFESSVKNHFGELQSKKVLNALLEKESFLKTSVNEMMSLLAVSS